jgi:crotonobetainyl-CoA:carnitine CoA-transferase CaiB-like acyl-CoA transferase
MAEWMSYPAYYTRDSGASLVRSGARHATIAPYGPFVAGDGKAVFFGIQNEREWTSFCQHVLADPELASDGRFRSNPDRLRNQSELEDLITACFSAWSSDQLIAKLEVASIANARLNDVQGFLGHPQLHERNRIRSVGSPAGPLDVFLPPVIIDGLEAVMRDVPAVGEHTRKIRDEFNC